MIPLFSALVSPLQARANPTGQRGVLSKPPLLTCNDCYFRRAGLCALEVEVTCPTFRLHSKGSLVPPRQPRLIPRPLSPVPAAA